MENRNRCGGAFLDGQAGARAAGDADLLSSTLQKERRMRGPPSKFGEEDLREEQAVRAEKHR